MTIRLLPSQIEYQKRLAEGLSTDGSARILAFKNKVGVMTASLASPRQQLPPSPVMPGLEISSGQSLPPAQAPEPPKGYENAMTALYSRNAAPRPVRKIARSLPQVRTPAFIFRDLCMFALSGKRSAQSLTAGLYC